MVFIYINTLVFLRNTDFDRAKNRVLFYTQMATKHGVREAEPKNSKPSAPTTSVTVQAPQHLNLKTNSAIAENWRIWLQSWEDFSLLSNLEAKPESHQLATFRQALGDDARRLISNIMRRDETPTIDSIITKLNEYCIGQTNEMFERYRFSMRKRKPEETIMQYVTELQAIARNCNFCQCMYESLLRDQLARGIENGVTTRKLLSMKNLTLEQCIDICSSEENTDTHYRQMQPARQSQEVYAIAPPRGPPPSVTDRSCRFCGTRHQRTKENCPAWGKTCMKCRKKNHFARCCQSSNVAQIEEAEREDTLQAEPEYTINHISNRQTAIFARLHLNGREIKFQLDSGASINIMPRRLATDMKIEATPGVLKMWNGSSTRPLGKATATIRNPQDNQSRRITFMIVKEDLPPILGLDAIQQFEFVTVNHDRFIHACNLTDKLVDSYPCVFNGGLGKFEGEAHLMLNDRAPVALPARRVPFALRERLQAELERLCKLDVLKKVEKPTDWVSQIAVVTKKNGELRICIDPKPLNEALRRERYALPTLDDILPDLAKAKYFTKVDLSSAFWHVPLDIQSSYITTFATPYGRYRWTRLPFGLC
ncbi:MAG: reverse transcriptase domain-containing protein, partial [Candidatus Thiodiazotropha sp.]